MNQAHDMKKTSKDSLHTMVPASCQHGLFLLKGHPQVRDQEDNGIVLRMQHVQNRPGFGSKSKLQHARKT